LSFFIFSGKFSPAARNQWYCIYSSRVVLALSI